MRYIWQIITIILAATVLFLSLDSLRSSDKIELSDDVSNSQDIIINSIMTRSSIRKYSDKKVDRDTIETILKAGMAAPTAGNRQPWEFYVVNDTSVIKQFGVVSRYISPMNEYASTAIIVCGNPSKSFPSEPRYWVQDCSAATENILLAAHAMGLGAVWCGVYPVEAQVEILRGMLNMPTDLIPLNIIFIGYPAVEPTIKDKWKPDKVHYIN